jgi:hypothetical protein
MNNDNELFKLCKEVFEKTGWDEQKFYFETSGFDTAVRQKIGKPSFTTLKLTPLYNSDYLLEKLPKIIDDRRITLQPVVVGWDASYDLVEEADDSILDSFSNTPLKALLKLTLTLVEEGKLK